MKNPQGSEKSTPRSEGARLLRSAGTIAEIAAETGLSQRSIGSYRGGSAEPADDARAKICRAFPHIKSALWDRPPEIYREPAWLSEAVGMLVDYPAAQLALRREVVRASGDVAELEAFHATEAALRAEPPYSAIVALEAAAIAAEEALAAALDEIDGPRVRP